MRFRINQVNIYGSFFPRRGNRFFFGLRLSWGRALLILEPHCLVKCGGLAIMYPALYLAREVRREIFQSCEQYFDDPPRIAK